MSHYQPILISTEESTPHILPRESQMPVQSNEHDNSPPPQVKFSCLQIDSITEVIAIFDLDPEITVIIDDSHIPSTVFDYLNPLLLDPISVNTTAHDPQRPGKILFYSQQQQQFKISCYQLYCKKDLYKITDMTVHYPPNYYIDYASVKVSRTGNADSFWKCNLPHSYVHATNVDSAVPNLENLMNMLSGRLFRIAMPTDDDDSDLQL